MEEERWEREALRDVALAVVQEQRRARRWGIFFKLLLVAYVSAFLLLSPACQVGGMRAPDVSHAALVDINGPIMADSIASAERIIQGLQAAFASEKARAVVLRVNSPGGSPVDSGRINDEIIRLREAYPDKPVYAVVGDMAASGAYYAVASVDRIFVDKASMIGSIGVMMGSFGFTEAIERLGVERRLFTSGEHKGFMDPFSPLPEGQVEHIATMLTEIHAQFVDVVRVGRGERLTDEVDVFNGLIWTGERGIELGLADELGSIEYVVREVVGVETMVDYTPVEDFLSRFAAQLGASAGARIASWLSASSPMLQ